MLDQDRLRVFAAAAELERPEVLVPIAVGRMRIRLDPCLQALEIGERNPPLIHPFQKMSPYAPRQIRESDLRQSRPSQKLRESGSFRPPLFFRRILFLQNSRYTLLRFSFASCSALTPRSAKLTRARPMVRWRSLATHRTLRQGGRNADALSNSCSSGSCWSHLGSAGHRCWLYLLCPTVVHSRPHRRP